MTERKKDFAMVFIAIGFAIMLLLEVFRTRLFGNGQMGELLFSIFTRYIGSFICLVVIYKYSVRNILFNRPRHLWLMIPCLVVAINNFHFIAFFKGDAYINGNAAKIIIFAIMCLGVGVFEELAFRGCVFMMILKNRRKTTRDIFISIVISSLIFGAVHLSNLLAGASPSSVIIQIGYSFLVGGMCSVILIKTRNIFCCVVLHAIYNFAGTIIPTLGGGTLWNPPTVIITAIIAVTVAVIIVAELIKYDPGELDYFYKKN